MQIRNLKYIMKQNFNHMKTSNFLILMLAAAVFAGCAQKDGKAAQDAEQVAVDTAKVQTDTVAPAPEVKEEPAVEEIAPKKKGTLASFLKQRTNPKVKKGEAYLVGTIDNKYAIHMSLWWECDGHETYYDPVTNRREVFYGYSMRGGYYYDKGGSVKNYMRLDENDITKMHMVLSEYNSKGKCTGRFDGRVKGDVYEGTFIRTKDGKRMPFKLTYVLDKNNGKFVKSTAY